MGIHPTAIVDPQAEVHPDAEVGPYVVIDAGVRLGARCRVGLGVYLTGQTDIGPDNHFHAGCVIGDAPQDLKYRGEPTRLIIGAHNVFREHVTVHRSNTPEEPTVVGSHCFLMAGSHVGHNCRLGDRVILANGALLGGHVEVQEAAFISGNCVVHQFVRIGRLAMMQGGSAISLDLPPATIARGDNTVSGLNVVGLRRAGVDGPTRLELRRLFRVLLLPHRPLAQRLAEAHKLAQTKLGQEMVQFVETSRRGCCPARWRSSAGTRDAQPDQGSP